MTVSSRGLRLPPTLDIASSCDPACYVLLSVIIVISFFHTCVSTAVLETWI